jgi:hypothetical protein
VQAKLQNVCGFIRIFVWAAFDLDVKIRQESVADSAEVLEVIRLAFGRSAESNLLRNSGKTQIMFQSYLWSPSMKVM